MKNSICLNYFLFIIIIFISFFTSDPFSDKDYPRGFQKVILKTIGQRQFGLCIGVLLYPL